MVLKTFFVNILLIYLWLRSSKFNISIRLLAILKVRFPFFLSIFLNDHVSSLVEGSHGFKSFGLFLEDDFCLGFLMAIHIVIPEHVNVLNLPEIWEEHPHVPLGHITLILSDHQSHWPRLRIFVLGNFQLFQKGVGLLKFLTHYWLQYLIFSVLIFELNGPVNGARMLLVTPNP